MNSDPSAILNVVCAPAELTSSVLGSMRNARCSRHIRSGTVDSLGGENAKAKSAEPASRRGLIMERPRDRKVLPNGLRLSCGAKLSCSQTEFYHPVPHEVI